MKKTVSLLLSLVVSLSLLSGCGNSAVSSPSSASSSTEEAPASSVEEAVSTEKSTLPDGIYTAEFITDSSMFHANETCNGLGTLTVSEGQMTLHVSLVSTSIINLFVGTAEDAQAEGAVWLEHTLDTVTYPDGLSEEVYGFDIPLTVLDQDFDLALLGKKGKWYDHVVSVRNAQPKTAELPTLEDGTYSCAVRLEGGTGRASIQSPATLTVQDGIVTAEIVWSSNKYDFMMVGDEKLLPLSTEEFSVFALPVSAFDCPLAVQADTIAMSKPHLVDYTLTFDLSSLQVTE